MSDYKVQPLNGLLAKAGSCWEFMEAVIPWAEPILADLGEVTPRLFFVTQDGQDGLLTFVSEATSEHGKDELAYKLRRFCALHGVKACAFLSTATLREPPRDDQGSEDSSGDTGAQDENERRSAGGHLLPVGTVVGWLCGEFLGEPTRVCVWKIDPSAGPVRVQQGWNTDVSGGGGRFVYLLGQGQELGYPVSDELRDRIVAHLRANIGRQRRPGTILSVEKGKTAGEIAMETDEGPGRTRIVEKDGFLYFVGLYSGTAQRRAEKSRLLAELGMDQAEKPNAGAMEVGQEPDNAEDYYSRGLAHGRKGGHDKAVADFTEAIRLRPDYPEAYYNRGLGYGLIGDHEKATADFSEVVRLKPDVAEAWFSRGVAYREKGDYARVIANFTEATRVEPDFAGAYYSRGVASGEKGDYDRAIADYTETIRLSADHFGAYCDRGIAYLRIGEYKKAIADYTAAIRLRPELAEAYNNRGLAYEEEGDYDKAIADYSESHRLKPDRAVAYYSRGLAYAEKGDYARAIADFTEAIRVKPDFAAAYHNRGAAYREKGMDSEAEDDFARAKELGFPPEKTTQ